MRSIFSYTQLLTISHSTAFLSQIRLPENISEVTHITLNYGLEIIPKYIEMFAPEKAEEAKAWYSGVIEPLKNSILKKNKFVVKSPEH